MLKVFKLDRVTLVLETMVASMTLLFSRTSHNTRGVEHALGVLDRGKGKRVGTCNRDGNQNTDS